MILSIAIRSACVVSTPRTRTATSTSARTAFIHPASAATGAGDWPKDTARIHIDNGTSIARISHIGASHLARRPGTDEVKHSIRSSGEHAPERRDGARSESENKLHEREVVGEIVRTHQFAVVGNEEIHLRSLRAVMRALAHER